MRNIYLITAFACIALVSILGLRGTTFMLPPIDVFPEWLFPGMNYQPKPRPQDATTFFADGRVDRRPPPRTVMRGMLREDDHLYRGRDAAGEFAPGFPAALTVDRALLDRGRDQYMIYCAVCHGSTGDGNGITKRYGMGATPTFHDERLRNTAEGDLYDVISNGRNTMLPYADKILPEDRWAVVAYVRALQRAQQGRPADVADAAARQSLGIQ
jgi:mono/diheme cytochrome c family protein